MNVATRRLGFRACVHAGTFTHSCGKTYTYCHSYYNRGPRYSFQRFVVPVYYWKTVYMHMSRGHANVNRVDAHVHCVNGFIEGHLQRGRSMKVCTRTQRTRICALCACAHVHCICGTLTEGKINASLPRHSATILRTPSSSAEHCASNSDMTVSAHKNMSVHVCMCVYVMHTTDTLPFC